MQCIISCTSTLGLGEVPGSQGYAAYALNRTPPLRCVSMMSAFLLQVGF